MHAEDTLDPSQLSTRRIESMSDLVAEMVLGACDGSESDVAAEADAAALAAARQVAIASPVSLPPPSVPPPPVLPSTHPPYADVDLSTIPDFRPSRARMIVATSAALALVASAVVALVALK